MRHSRIGLTTVRHDLRVTIAPAGEVFAGAMIYKRGIRVTTELDRVSQIRASFTDKLARVLQ